VGGGGVGSGELRAKSEEQGAKREDRIGVGIGIGIGIEEAESSREGTQRTQRKERRGKSKERRAESEKGDRMKRILMVVGIWGLCHGANAHGAWVYPDADSETGAVRPSALEARVALGQSAHTALSESGTVWRAEWQAGDAATLTNATAQAAASAAGLYQPIGAYLTAIPEEIVTGAAAGATAFGWGNHALAGYMPGTATFDDALRLIQSDTNAWIAVENGTGIVYRVTHSNTNVLVVSGAGLTDFNGYYTWNGDGYIHDVEGFGFFYGEGRWSLEGVYGITGETPIGQTGPEFEGVQPPYPTVTYGPVTNTYPLALFADLAAKYDASNPNGFLDAAGVGAIVAPYALAEVAVTGAVTTAQAGYRYYWTTATNVTLTASLTDAQVVNLAMLRNTATNSITAIGTPGWVWTGGNMTNTIPAGRMMTFGWARNPMT
jgi:hypothetical protein